MHPEALIVVLCTAPSEEKARDLARGLVEQHLVACAKVIPGVRSFYHWNGNVQDELEWQLVMKTTGHRWDDLVAWVSASHPYDVPELVALPAERASEPYAKWVREATAPR